MLRNKFFKIKTILEQRRTPDAPPAGVPVPGWLASKLRAQELKLCSQSLVFALSSLGMLGEPKSGTVVTQ